MPKFQQRHYEVIAATIREQFKYWYRSSREDAGAAEDALDRLAEDLIVVFNSDNPHFNPEKFREATR